MWGGVWGLVVLEAVALSLTARVDAGSLRFSNVLGSHMVLQRGRPAPVWGWDTPGSEVTVQFQGQSLKATAAPTTGFWRVTLPQQPATLTGATITASSGSGTVTLNDVLFGEVVLCSGQSNMEFVVPAAVNATAEINAADGYPHVRLFTGPMQGSDKLYPNTSIFNVTHDEAYYVRMNWSVASAKVVGGCNDPTNPNCDTCCGNPVAKEPFGTGSYVSAVCWYTVRDLADMLGGEVPVGGIDQSYGGTSIQFWMGASAIAASNAPVASQCCGQNGGASCLYNTQIHPYTLGPMQFGGAIFYQGEQNANCGGPPQIANNTYANMLSAMIAEWRTELGQPSLPFGAVLLAPWKGRDMTSFPLLRLAQAEVANSGSNSFVVNTLDQGNPTNPEVHSPYKQAVGRRAALGIAATAGLAPTAEYLGPTYLSAAVSDAATGVVKVTFVAASLYGAAPVLNLSVQAPPTIVGDQGEAFAVQVRSSSSGQCQWLPATPSESGNDLLLTPTGWTSEYSVVATRAYFANWPIAMLKNVAGIPAVPWLARVDGAPTTCSLP